MVLVAGKNWQVLEFTLTGDGSNEKQAIISPGSNEKFLIHYIDWENVDDTNTPNTVVELIAKNLTNQLKLLPVTNDFTLTAVAGSVIIANELTHSFFRPITLGRESTLQIRVGTGVTKIANTTSRKIKIGCEVYEGNS